MREISPMFSLVATMRPEAFVAFREYTHGAGAIQSRSIAVVERVGATAPRWSMWLCFADGNKIATWVACRLRSATLRRIAVT
jgi:hypothetical protein